MADPVGNDAFISEMDIRRVLRDFPEANNLLDDYEYDAEEIRTAMTLTVDEWNDMAPTLSYYNINTFPYRSILIRGTVANLLLIAAHAARRNSLTYTAGGGSVKDQDHGPEYTQVAGSMMNRVLDDMRKKKNEENYAQSWGIC
jgi:hypothetical protein